MKKLLGFLLLVSVLVFAVSCSDKKEDLKMPVSEAQWKAALNYIINEGATDSPRGVISDDVTARTPYELETLTSDTGFKFINHIGDEDPIYMLVTPEWFVQHTADKKMIKKPEDDCIPGIMVIREEGGNNYSAVFDSISGEDAWTEYELDENAFTESEFEGKKTLCQELVNLYAEAKPRSDGKVSVRWVGEGWDEVVVLGFNSDAKLNYIGMENDPAYSVIEYPSPIQFEGVKKFSE